MYIWILLATIMVAFSFYNLSPRMDKDNSIAETKASVLVARLKIENKAIAEAFKCDLMYNAGSYEMTVAKDIDIEKDNPIYGDTIKTNLPIGYDVEKSSVLHQIICLDSDISNPNAKITDCVGLSSAYPEYIFSFMQIPERWLTKDGSNQPLPALLNHLSDIRSSHMHFGWVEHVDEDCYEDNDCYVFLGTNARGKPVENTPQAQVSDAVEAENHAKDFINVKKEGRVLEKAVRDDLAIAGEVVGGGVGTYIDRGEFVDAGAAAVTGTVSYDAIPKNSVVWKSEKFEGTCSGTPCLVAYTRISPVDKFSYCYNLVKKTQEGGDNNGNTGDGNGVDGGGKVRPDQGVLIDRDFDEKPIEKPVEKLK